MKTSFYFLFWIAIYPILGITGGAAVSEYAFIIALVGVFALSWLLNRLMPATLAYESAQQSIPLYEDIYTGNVKSFGRRLRSDMVLEGITALYFTITTVLLVYVCFVLRTGDYLALIIFGFFTLGAIMRAANLQKAMGQLKESPTGETMEEIGEQVYRVDYPSYYESRRQVYNPEGMLPPRPRYFNVFQWVSAAIAGVVTVLGLIFMVRGVISTVASSGRTALIAMGSINLLYGSLATYYGAKDLFTTVRAIVKSPIKKQP